MPRAQIVPIASTFYVEFKLPERDTPLKK